MKIDTNQNGEIILREVYSGVLMKTKESNSTGICMRDDTFEINVIPKGSIKSNWWRIDMQTGIIKKMGKDETLDNWHIIGSIKRGDQWSEVIGAKTNVGIGIMARWIHQYDDTWSCEVWHTEMEPESRIKSDEDEEDVPKTPPILSLNK